MPTGIYPRHQRSCRKNANKAARCNCTPSWQAMVYDAKTDAQHREHFQTQAEAKAWRSQALVELSGGRLTQARKVTVQAACDDYLKLAREGVVRTRSGDPYKPATIHTYEQALRLRVYPRLGTLRFDQLDLVRLQDHVDRLVAEGWSEATVMGAVTPLKAVYGRALERREVPLDPTVGVKLPKVRSRRDRIAPVGEVDQLLAALEARDRAVWATAMLAGLRRGELMALRVEDVDLDAGTIEVRFNYDPRAREHQPTKNRERRKVPIGRDLAKLLREHMLLAGRRAGLLFGTTPQQPFGATQLTKRARFAWGWEREGRQWRKAREDALAAITLHECRHTYASLSIAAGVNAKALSTYMGHHSVAFTYDQYGHLMPGNEGEAAQLLDSYLDRARAANERKAI